MHAADLVGTIAIPCVGAAGTRKLTKTGPVAKKASPKTVPEAIFVSALFFSIFSGHLDLKLDQKSMKN